MFLTNVNVVKDIGECYGTIYETLLNMQSTVDSLRHIVWLMNLPTDLAQRAVACEARRLHTKHLRGDLVMRHPTKTSGLLDMEPIVLSNVNFSYEQGSGKLTPRLRKTQSYETLGTKIEIMQGSMVTIVGPRSEGKATLLKILGGVITPPESGIFVPAHLRILHIAAEPYFYKNTLHKNLTFGLHPDNPAASRERVRAICVSLGISEVTLRYLEDPTDCNSDECVQRWGLILSLTERHLLNIARALVFDPEVLIIHKPTLPFDERLSGRVLALLRQFVTERGIHLDPEQMTRRRPRTLIMSSAKIQGVKAADRILRVSKAHGLEELVKNKAVGLEELKSKEDVSNDHLSKVIIA
jgi:ABC-type multidrug transport system fused ATPase/permease subunit